MSYRSIKRVLGETSLERKCRFLFGACLLLLIAASFWLYGSRTERIVYRQNLTAAKILVDQTLYIRHWEQWTAKKEESQELATTLGQNLPKQKYESCFIKANPTRNTRKPKDEFEWSVLSRYSQPQPQRPVGSTPEEYPDRLVDNNYEYFQPVYADDKSCVNCHNISSGGLDNIGTGISVDGSVTSNPISKGDLMAIVKVTISNKTTQEEMNRNQAIFIATAIITVFLAMMASYAIIRYVIVKPLRHLRDVSDAVSRGNTSLRADIHTGDEFEELSEAFNRMLRHLIDAQEELRQLNVSLDGKVDELAQANMRLYELNMLKSDFLATMSHELRTPLNSILGFSEVLDSIDSLDEKQKRYVQNIQKSGKTLLEMINDILDLAKIENGKMETRPSDFRIAQVVAAQCDMARPLTERKKHRHRVHRRRRSAADAPGPGPGAANPQQSALERHQIHARGRANRRLGHARRVELLDAPGDRHGRGHRPGGSTDDFREVPSRQDGHAQRRRHDARVFGQRPGAFDRQGALPAVGRRGFATKRAWQGQHVHRPHPLDASRPTPARRRDYRRF